jgi:hypothetical protein
MCLIDLTRPLVFPTFANFFSCPWPIKFIATEAKMHSCSQKKKRLSRIFFGKRTKQKPSSSASLSFQCSSVAEPGFLCTSDSSGSVAYLLYQRLKLKNCQFKTFTAIFSFVLMRILVVENVRKRLIKVKQCYILRFACGVTVLGPESPRVEAPDPVPQHCLAVNILCHMV